MELHQPSVAHFGNYFGNHVSPEAEKVALLDAIEAFRATPWRQRAACRSEDVDPSWFMPNDSGALEHKEEALAVCATCPVRAECRAFATTDDVGIFGGEVLTGSGSTIDVTAGSTDLAELCHMGLSVREIAARLGMNRETVRDRLKARGLTTTRTSRVDTQAVVTMYVAQGLPIYKIAERLGVGDTAVRSALVRAGVQIIHGQHAKNRKAAS